MIYNFAPHYREAIFRLIDREYDCEWFFGNNRTDIKGLDISVLKHTTIVPYKTFISKPLYYQSGVVKLFWRKDFTTYFILGDPFCISSWILVVLLRIFKPRKHIYFWSHGWYGKENIAKKLIKKVYFKLAHGIFLYGRHAKELMLGEGFHEDRLFVIHNSLYYDIQKQLRESLSSSGIYRQHFGNKNGNLIFIGRLTAVKRLDLLIEALYYIKQKGREFNLTLIGNGTETDALKELVVARKLQAQVWFYGACYDETTNAELIYNADLCVAPGNVGLTAMHTMVFGTPVITHDCFKYQMPEFEAVRPNETGNFFKYGDSESLAESIIQWFDKYEGSRQKIREACYREIDTNWTPEFQIKVIREHLKIT